jgi:Beta-lactamase enzyme family
VRFWVVLVLTIGAVVAGAIDVSVAHRKAPANAAVTYRAQVSRSNTNPLRTHAMRTLLSHRAGQIGIAVDNLRTGKLWWYHPGFREQTASIVKVDILETLLRQAMDRNAPLSEETAETAQGMIENSDNDDATDLWNQVGGASGIAAYNAKAGLTATSPNTDGYWGETLTTAPDQISLLKQLVLPHGLLNRASQDYQLGLMSNVESDQRWGVSGGVPSSARVALKNGWLPLSGNDWQINSIGRIRGDGRWYLIAVLTTGDPTEAYGIDTIEAISALVYRTL